MFQQLLSNVKALVQPRPSKLAASRFREISGQQRQTIHNSLVEHYFSRMKPGYLETTDGQVDLKNHLDQRLDNDRQVVIPWLESARPTHGSTILEIGCGTGCSTVALAEQGADVTAVDLDEPSMHVARTRCEAYALDVDFHLANVVDAPKLLQNRRFDFVIFYAALEHMTHDERIEAIRNTWQMVSPGGFWCVVETPNRLWYFDGHTSLLPFYLWLPDDLAFKYSRLSPRDGFRENFREPGDEQMLEFLRQGRGVSYHEFELALDQPAERHQVVSSLTTYSGRVNFLRKLKWPRSLETRYSSLLREVHPKIHPGFLQPSLDLILQPST